MDTLVSNVIYRVPTIGGPKVRIRVQTYADGDACFIAAPGHGELDEPPAMNAIAGLLGYLVSSGESVAVTQRTYRFSDVEGEGVVTVPDSVIVSDGARRIRGLLLVIHRCTIAPMSW